MARTVYLNGGRVILSDSEMFAEGGEAEIFAKGETIFKVWKKPDHPDYAFEQRDRDGAKQRIEEHQQKMRQFPAGLPPEVVAPRDLLFNKGGDHILGFTMAKLPSGASPIRDLGQPSNAFPYDRITNLFLGLGQTVEQLHACGIVIGDFNNLNVLTLGDKAYVLDADSMQFGGFLSRTFAARFVDPLICDSTKTSLLQVKPHSEGTDWYAYLVMLFESIFKVHPYGGVYRSKEVKRDERPLKGISVLHDGVSVPKRMLPFNRVDEDLMHLFFAYFEELKREGIPRELLEGLRWEKCSVCGLWHSRPACPACVGHRPKTTPAQQVLGEILYQRIFEGTLVHARAAGGELSYLYQQDGTLYREGGRRVAPGSAAPGMRFRLAGEKTVVAQGPNAVIIAEGAERLGVDTYRGRVSQVDTSARDIFYISGGTLYKNGEIASVRIGDVLQHQTLFWAGPKFGFGFYRAGQVCVAFIFDQSINDSVPLEVKGSLIDATAYFTNHRCWFFTATKEGSEVYHRCYVINSKGEITATAVATEGDGSWLGTSIRGKAAAETKAHSLFSLTDTGMIRVDEQGGTLSVTREYPDTAQFADASHHLFFTDHGLAVVKPKEVGLLTMKPTK